MHRRVATLKWLPQFQRCKSPPPRVAWLPSIGIGMHRLPRVVKRNKKKSPREAAPVYFAAEGEAGRQEGDRQRRDRGGDTWRDSSPGSSRPGGNLSRQYPKPRPRRSRHCSSAQLRHYLTEILSADPHRSLSVLGLSPPPSPSEFDFYIKGPNTAQTLRKERPRCRAE